MLIQDIAVMARKSNSKTSQALYLKTFVFPDCNILTIMLDFYTRISRTVEALELNPTQLNVNFNKEE
jgi:hypothetical protein